MALKLCKLHGITRLATIIASTVTLANTGELWPPAGVALWVQRSCVASRDAKQALEVTVMLSQIPRAQPHAKLAENLLPKLSWSGTRDSHVAATPRWHSARHLHRCTPVAALSRDWSSTVPACATRPIEHNQASVPRQSLWRLLAVRQLLLTRCFFDCQ